MKTADQCLQEALSLERAAILTDCTDERLKLLRAAESLLMQALVTLSNEVELTPRRPDA